MKRKGLKSPARSPVSYTHLDVYKRQEVPLDYHPRFQDTRKTYEYTFYNARYDNPVTSRHHHFVYVPLDVEKMKKAASYFLGEHCFISMCSSKAQVTSYVREIYECNVTQNGRYITMRCV